MSSSSSKRNLFKSVRKAKSSLRRRERMLAKQSKEARAENVAGMDWNRKNELKQ